MAESTKYTKEIFNEGFAQSLKIMERMAGIIAYTHDGERKDAARREFAEAFKLGVISVVAEMFEEHTSSEDSVPPASEPPQ